MSKRGAASAAREALVDKLKAKVRLLSQRLDALDRDRHRALLALAEQYEAKLEEERRLTWLAWQHAAALDDQIRWHREYDVRREKEAEAREQDWRRAYGEICQALVTIRQAYRWMKKNTLAKRVIGRALADADKVRPPHHTTFWQRVPFWVLPLGMVYAAAMYVVGAVSKKKKPAAE